MDATNKAEELKRQFGDKALGIVNIILDAGLEEEYYNFWVEVFNELDKKEQPPVKCFCCGKQINYLSEDTMALDDATRAEVRTGWGSRLDGDIYEIIICDDCLKAKTESRLATFKGRYFH